MFSTENFFMHADTLLDTFSFLLMMLFDADGKISSVDDMISHHNISRRFNPSLTYQSLLHGSLNKTRVMGQS